MIAHIIPMRDIKKHVISADCWCIPLMMDGYKCVHNAKDTREKYERQGRPLKNKPWKIVEVK
jgi:hypothetical protein